MSALTPPAEPAGSSEPLTPIVLPVGSPTRSPALLLGAAIAIVSGLGALLSRRGYPLRAESVVSVLALALAGSGPRCSG